MIRHRDYMTSFRVAELTGLTIEYIRKLLINGKIKGEKLGNYWFVHSKDFKDFQRKRLQMEKIKNGNN